MALGRWIGLLLLVPGYFVARWLHQTYGICVGRSCGGAPWYSTLSGWFIVGVIVLMLGVIAVGYWRQRRSL